MIRTACVVLMLAAALPACAGAPEIEDVVRGFYTAWAAGDAATASGFWEQGTPAATRIARTLRTRCLIVQQLAVTNVTIDGASATATIDAVMSRWSHMPGAPFDTERELATIALHRDRTQWKIAAIEPAEEELVRRLAALDGRAARERALQAAPELRTRLLVEALSRRAVTMVNQDQPGRAMEIVELAKEEADALDDPAAQATALGAESVLFRAAPVSDAAAGLRAACAAIEFAEHSGDPDTLARALQRAGRAQADARHVDEAITAFERALALRDFVEDASIVALAASQLARYQGVRNEVRYSAIASELAHEAGDPAAIISAEMNFGGLYMSRGDYEMAIPHIRKLVALAEQNGYASTQADALESLAACEYLLGRGENFLELTAKALSLLNALVNPAGTLDVLTSRAEYCLQEGDYACAERELTKAEEAHGGIPNGKTVTDFLAAKARLLAHQHRFDEAHRVLAMLYDEVPSLWARADVLREQGRREEEQRALEEAIGQVEWYRTALDYERHRVLYLAEYSAIYVRLIENLADRGDVGGALGVAERMRARGLKDLLAGARESSGSGEAEIEQRNARITELNRRLLAIQHDGGDTTAVQVQLRRARGDLEEALIRGSLAQPAAVDPPMGDAAAVAIPAGVTVVEFVVGRERTTAFVMRSGARVEVHRIAITESALRTRVARFVKAIESRDERYRTDAHSLYNLLLRPLLGPRPSRDMLCIIPDRSLWTLPFQALMTDGGEHVIERAPLFYAPSLSVLAGPAASHPSHEAPTILAIGNPDVDANTKREVTAVHRDAALGRLPDAEREVRELGRLYGARATIRTGMAAAESSLKRDADRFDVVHLATHGIIDDRFPMYSALLLAGSESEDGLLEAREIMSLPLHAELVVLSACDTARGAVMDGEGVISLSWAILATGCPRTIGTQWRVGSAAAASLMVAFHRRLATRASVDHVAASLREAQLEMLRSRYYAHPYYWAGFVMVGREK